MTVDGTGDAPTVQAGIDSASHGDVVLVGPGRYVENVDLKGKGIHLLGEMGPEATVLDGSGAEAPVVTCVSGETNATVIEGLTITGGRGRPFGLTAHIGGGLYCSKVSPVIRGNVIRSNRAESENRYDISWGGGIVITATNGSGVLEGNIIEDNMSSGNAGGILAEGSCWIRRNVIRGNRTQYGDGGGVYIGRTPQSVYRDNLILENEAGDHGGGIYVNNSGPTAVPAADIEITGNVLIANRAWGRDGATDCSGGGIWVSHRGAVIRENTIAFSQVGGLRSPLGGGICLESTQAGTTVESNVIYRNPEGGVVAQGSPSGVWQALVRRNVIFGNGPVEVYNEEPARFVLELEENVFADPLFCLMGSASRGELAGVSPALNQPWGMIGAVAESGCGPYFDGPPDSTVAVERISWGAIKARYGP